MQSEPDAGFMSSSERRTRCPCPAGGEAGARRTDATAATARGLDEADRYAEADDLRLGESCSAPACLTEELLDLVGEPRDRKRQAGFTNACRKVLIEAERPAQRARRLPDDPGKDADSAGSPSRTAGIGDHGIESSGELRRSGGGRSATDGEPGTGPRSGLRSKCRRGPGL